MHDDDEALDPATPGREDFLLPDARLEDGERNRVGRHQRGSGSPKCLTVMRTVSAGRRLSIRLGASGVEGSKGRSLRTGSDSSSGSRELVDAEAGAAAEPPGRYHVLLHDDGEAAYLGRLLPEDQARRAQLAVKLGRELQAVQHRLRIGEHSGQGGANAVDVVRDDRVDQGALVGSRSRAPRGRPVGLPETPFWKTRPARASAVVPQGGHGCSLAVLAAKTVGRKGLIVGCVGSLTAVSPPRAACRPGSARPAERAGPPAGPPRPAPTS